MYLLDTNALIWTLTKLEMLTDHALDIITNTDNKLYTSVGSLWEITHMPATGTIQIYSDFLE